ncbi:HAD family hydrolase [Nocardioides baekrokdamisoli]|nr:HAD family phosphatase [Nocardioides baekrokdamisoli]
MPAAVLFDMDGTLVDTEHLWLEVARTVATQAERPLAEDDLQHVLGRPIAHTAGYLHATGATGTLEDLTRDLDDGFTECVAREITPLPGVRGLLRELARAGVPTAIVSASERRVVDMVMDALGREFFTCSIAEGEAAASKPAPDPYLAAAALLGVDPRHCVAVEDTPLGVAAAEAAGCAVLAVPSAVPIALAHRRTVAPSLRGIDMHVLAAVLGPRAV